MTLTTTTVPSEPALLTSELVANLLNSSMRTGIYNDSNATIPEMPANYCISMLHRSEDPAFRFYSYALLQAAICIFGILGNIVTTFVLTRKEMQSANHWLLSALAVTDVGVLTGAFLIYFVEYLFLYTENAKLYSAWFIYLRVTFMLSHAFQVASTYLTVAASFERWLASLNTHKEDSFTKAKTFSLIFMISLLVLLLTLSKYWEIDVMYHADCPDFAKYAVKPGPLLENWIYSLVYSIWATFLCFVFIPFLILVIFNVLTIWNMSRPNSIGLNSINLTMSPWQKHMENQQILLRSREATRVLIVIVFVFLICKLPSLILTLLEQSMQNFLYNHPGFYSKARDTVNMLTAINSACNFVIYLRLSGRFRRELYTIVFQCLRISVQQPTLLVNYARRQSTIAGTKCKILRSSSSRDSTQSFRTYDVRYPVSCSVPFDDRGIYSNNHNHLVKSPIFSRPTVQTATSTTDDCNDEISEADNPVFEQKMLMKSNSSDKVTKNGDCSHEILSPVSCFNPDQSPPMIDKTPTDDYSRCSIVSFDSLQVGMPETAI